MVDAKGTQLLAQGPHAGHARCFAAKCRPAFPGSRAEFGGGRRASQPRSTTAERTGTAEPNRRPKSSVKVKESAVLALACENFFHRRDVELVLFAPGALLQENQV